MQNKNIKVSIVVPVYNVENYLEKCINSILEQTHKNLEIIMVDDGSTDNSGIILDRYAEIDSRIFVIHKQNEKVSTARNVGINRSTGDYVCFADADDYLMPEYVEYLLDLAVSHQADIAMSTDMYTTFHTKQNPDTNIEVKNSKEGLIDILTYNMPIGVYCKIFKKEFLGNEVRFIPDIYIGEGFNFNSCALQRANKVVEGHRKIYFYRRDNPTSATTKFNIRKWENAIYAIENIKKDLIIRDSDTEIAWNYANWHTHCDAFNFLVMSGEQSKFNTQYKNWKNIVRYKAWYSFKVKISNREKLRALIYMIIPELMPFLIDKRNRFYKK